MKQNKFTVEQLNEALLAAARTGDSRSATSLIEAGADVNAETEKGWTAVAEAWKNGHVEAARTLIKAGADCGVLFAWLTNNFKGNREESLKSLIEIGADVNNKDRYGQTALIWAATNGHMEIIQPLISAGADLNAQNNNGWTALMYAARRGYEKAVKDLIHAGADVNSQNTEGATALQLAIMGGRTEAAKALIQGGADVNHEYRNGWTALMMAARNGPAEIVKDLVAAGANLDATDKVYFQTARDKAGSPEIKALLDTAAADAKKFTNALLSAVGSPELLQEILSMKNMLKQPSEEQTEALRPRGG